MIKNTSCVSRPTKCTIAIGPGGVGGGGGGGGMLSSPRINTQLTLKDSQLLLTTASDWKDLAREQTITPWMILIWTRSSGSLRTPSK